MREKDREQGRGRERRRHRMWSRLQALSCQHMPDAGLELTDCEIMTWAKVSCLTNWATQAPLCSFRDQFSELLLIDFGTIIWNRNTNSFHWLFEDVCSGNLKIPQILSKYTRSPDYANLFVPQKSDILSCQNQSEHWKKTSKTEP